MGKIIKPYGTWPSAISAEIVAGQALRFGLVSVMDGDVYWSEQRPAEKGRSTLMRMRPGREPEEILPPSFSVRSRVHEYGGGDYRAQNHKLFFVNDGDQDLYQLSPTCEVRRLTDNPSLRFADMEWDPLGKGLITVCERHPDQGSHHPENFLATIDLNAAPRDAVKELVTGHDFFASPRLNKKGDKLLWLAWDLPDMPWESATLYLAERDKNGIFGRPQQIAGGAGSAVFQPQWREDDTLIFVWDKSGWSNLYCFKNQRSEHIIDCSADFGRPLWTFGMTSYAVNDEGEIWASYLENGINLLAKIKAAASELSPLKTALKSIDSLHAVGHDLVAIGTYDEKVPAIVRIATETGEITTLRASAKLSFKKEDLSIAQTLSFPGNMGAPVYGHYYPPINSNYEGPEDDRPPVILAIHGGPTAAADRGLKLKTQFWTSRGFAVFDVDYSGSSGYGRAYRERLDGAWGVREVGDIIAAAHFLVDQGLADQKKLLLSGSSAGGYSLLMTLVNSQIFAAASCSYGISDLSLLVGSTHKFEAGYLYRLIGIKHGPKSDLLQKRSPLSAVHRITTPVIFFQGLEDKVVPPAQSLMIVKALRKKGITIRHIEFKQEGHGFRQAETVQAVLNYEYEFFMSILDLIKDSSEI